MSQLRRLLTLAVITLTTPAATAAAPRPATQPALSPELTAILATLSSSGSEETAKAAAVARLKVLGARADPIVPALGELIETPRGGADRKWVIRGVIAIHSSATVIPLCQAANVSLGRDTALIHAEVDDALDSLGPLVIPALSAAALDPKHPYRSLAITFLGLRGPAAIPELEKVIASPEKERSHIIGANSAITIARAQSAPLLLEMWRALTTDAERNASFDLIKRMDGIKALEPCLIVLKDPDPQIRALAARTAAAIAADDRYKDSPTVVRLTHVHRASIDAALAGLPPPAPSAPAAGRRGRGMAGVTPSIADADALRGALVSLQTLATSHVAGADEEKLTSQAAAQRLAAIDTLIKFHESTAIPGLERAAKSDTEFTIRVAAAVALLEFPESALSRQQQEFLTAPPDARKALFDKLYETDAGRVAIIEAFGRATDPAVKDLLFKWGGQVPANYALQTILSDNPKLNLGSLFVIAGKFSDNVGLNQQQSERMPRIVHKVMDLTSDPSSETAQWAASALAQLGKYAASDVANALTGTDLAKKRNAARIVGFMFSVPEPMVAPLTKAVSDTDAELRAYAVLALSRVDRSTPTAQYRPLPIFLHLAHEKDAALRQSAVDGLAMILITNPAALAGLNDLAKDPDAHVSLSARIAVALDQVIHAHLPKGNFQDDGDDLVPPQTRPASTAPATTRGASQSAASRPATPQSAGTRPAGTLAAQTSPAGTRPAETLAAETHPVDPLATLPVATVAAQLTDKATTTETRIRAAHLLGYYSGTSAKDAATALGPHLSTTTLRRLRLQAIESAARLGPDAAPLAPQIVHAMQEDDFDISIAAIIAAPKLGTDASPYTIPALVKLWDALDPRVRDYAQNALTQLGTSALPALVEFLKQPGPKVYYAARALGHIGPAAAPAAPELVRLLNDADHNLNEVALDALIGIGTAVDPQSAQAAAPRLAELLVSKDIALRDKAARAVGAIHCTSTIAITALGKALPDRFVCQSALYALKQLGPDASAAVPAIVEFLEAERKKSVSPDAPAAIDALAAIGPAAKDALPFLKDLQANPFPGSEYPPRIEAAIKQIDPPAKVIEKSSDAATPSPAASEPAQ